MVELAFLLSAGQFSSRHGPDAVVAYTAKYATRFYHKERRFPLARTRCHEECGAYIKTRCMRHPVAQRMQITSDNVHVGSFPGRPWSLTHQVYRRSGADAVIQSDLLPKVCGTFFVLLFSLLT